ncbi:aspartate aminotransferase family protein [Pseudomonas turukhanskensis]|uniref:Aspartate aminotransferase family protein n=1 Tax=Pseudomonas turukhanskensis TaxID=1806536 RepID=A0A9W6NHI2_9PSED|nr:aspartate aminotransferase family protein [Pseudomonas turukhanskensis]GLK91138.1 aspartate aminotransferase family protein [Pseudomonas turukhanskensis]
MPGSIDSFATKDVRYQLHSYADARAHEQKGPLIIERGDGVFVVDDKGNRYLEAMAGLWSVALGFSEQRLVDAAHRQLQTLPFYHTFGHKSHTPSIALAERLIELAPVPMSKVYFTNSGSEANDVLIKLIWYRNNAIGQPRRKKIISRVGGYHGVTALSASLTGLSSVHTGFDLPLPGFLHVSTPHFYRQGRPGETEEQFAARLADELEDLILREGPETIAAFVAEPVMGAGGVIVAPATYWERVQQVCRRHNVLMVADEVICGFGRTGKRFGCETFGITPDAMILSKQLSSSYQPIAAVLINEHLYSAIADQSHALGVLGTGFTGSGHPVAAAVALANITIIEQDQLIEHAASMGQRLHAALQRLSASPLVGEVRGCGLIAAVELVGDKPGKTPFGTVGRLGKYFTERAQANGLIVRGIGDSIALCPPLIISADEIDWLVERFERSLNETYDWMTTGA